MDLKAGQKAQRQMTVTHETVKAYAELTGDYNPLHFACRQEEVDRDGRQQRDEVLQRKRDVAPSPSGSGHFGFRLTTGSMQVGP